MSANQGDDDARVDEDERIGDDDERRALDLAAAQALAALLTTCKVIATFQQQSGHNR